MTTLVFPSISFGDFAAEAYAAALRHNNGTSISPEFRSACRKRGPGPVENGFDLALGVSDPMGLVARRWWRRALPTLLLAVAAIVLALASSKNDWNHLFQKTHRSPDLGRHLPRFLCDVPPALANRRLAHGPFPLSSRWRFSRPSELSKPASAPCGCAPAPRNRSLRLS
jgi:hypothetical protein